MISPTSHDVLSLADIRDHFLTNGTLSVNEEDKIIPVLVNYIRHFEVHGLPIFPTRNWHPPDALLIPDARWSLADLYEFTMVQFYPELGMPPRALCQNSTGECHSAY